MTRHATLFVRGLLALALAMTVGLSPTWAQMDLRLVSGVPRPVPATELPAGTVSVRVVRSAMTNNVAGVDVVFTVDGKTTTVKTGEDGRAQIDGVARGARLKAATVVDGERLESQEVTIDDAGIRYVLVAAIGAGGAPTALGPATAGRVVLGPESRIVADFSEERLNIYYAVQIVNGAATPVDIGGPVIFELPRAARGANVMDGSTPQAKASGARVTVTGPFAPGATNVNIAFELPYSGPVAHLEQKWPVDTQGISVFALKTGDIDLASPQLTGKQNSVQQGQPLVMGLVPAQPANQTFSMDISGLPHHPVWPRYTALGAGGAVVLVGLWAAFGPPSRRRRT